MLVLVRHAEAVAEQHALGDACRHLTPAGRQAALALGRRLRARLGADVEIAASPLARALQTAELLAAAWPEVVVVCLPALAPGADPHPLLALGRNRGTRLWVGHEPGLSGLGSLVIDGDLPPLGRAEAVALDAGQVLWHDRG